MIKDDLERICKEFPQVKLVLLGDLGAITGIFKNIPEKQKEFHSWLSHAAYPLKMKLLNLDIGLAPITNNDFNKKKTALKWMDYTMSGAATIASNISPYADAIAQDRTGKLAEDDEWYDAMKFLITQKQLRMKMASNALEDIRENYNADKSTDLWMDAYNKLLTKGLRDELHV